MADRPLYIHERMGGKCQPGDIVSYILVPGSKNRKKFTALWNEAREVAHHSEFLLYTGEYKGIPISACSTGCGGRPRCIAVDEMAALGGTTFLRTGVTKPLVD